MTFLASISLCTHTSLFASLCGRGRVHTEIPSLSRFDEALADPAYCVCSELPAQCGVVCVRVSCRQTPGLPGHAWAYLLAVRLGGLHRRHPRGN